VYFSKRKYILIKERHTLIRLIRSESFATVVERTAVLTYVHHGGIYI